MNVDINLQKSETDERQENIIEKPVDQIKAREQTVIKDSEEHQMRMQESLGISTSSSWVDKIVQYLSKGVETRTQKQTEALMNYAKQSKSFGEIMDKFSYKLVKSLINHKSKEVIHLNEDTILVKQGQRINYLYFLVHGKLQKTANAKQLPDFQEVFEKLGLAANQEVKQLAKLKKKSDSLDHPRPQSKRYSKISQKQFIGLDFSEDSYICGLEDRAIDSKYNSTVVAKEDSWVLAIPEADFLISLHLIMEEKVKMFMQKIKNIPCFKHTEEEKIETFILSLAERKKTKGCEIYKQGDSTSSIYILTKGEVKLTKISNLFTENPNNLSVNRLRLLNFESQSTTQRPRYQIQQNLIKKKEAILPYADLSSMYNYHPMRKNIQICRMEPFCMFGQQEHIEGKNRDTSAVCNSISVTYYEITLKRIQQIFGPRAMPAFMQGLKEAAKQKILKRQENYANAIHLQNQANMKYFYYEGQKQASNSLKFRINKINKAVQGRNTVMGSQKYSNHSSLPFKRNQLQHQKTDNDMNPFYTTFNFNKLKPGTNNMNPNISRRYKNDVVSSSTNNSPQKQKNQLSRTLELAVSPPRFSFSLMRQSNLTKRTLAQIQKVSKISASNTKDQSAVRQYQTLNPQQQRLVRNNKTKEVIWQQASHDGDDDDAGDQYLNANIKPAKQQLKIMNITHTWKLIKKKVDTQYVKSQRISPQKYTIDVMEPLIPNKFLIDLDKEKKRVERKIRKDKITLVPQVSNSRSIQRRSLKFS